MTIPQHLIDKALDAWIGDHNCPHPDQIGIYRVLITRSLEAVAGEIWDEGNLAGCDRSENHDNPYRASETE